MNASSFATALVSSSPAMASFQANQATCTSSIGLASSELDLQVVPSSQVIPSLAIAIDRQDFP